MKVSLNSLRDKIKRLEDMREAYATARSRVGVVRVTKESGNKLPTDAEVEELLSAHSYEEYTQLVEEMQSRITKLKTILNNANNTPRESAVLGKPANLHELLIELTFCNKELNHMKNFSNNGMKPEPQRVDSFRAEGFEFNVYTYEESKFMERFERLQDRLSFLRREIDTRNETVQIDIADELWK